MKKYRFIITHKGADTSNLQIMDIIDIQENLTEQEITKRINWLLDNGYYQFADYKIEEMEENK